MTLAIVCSGQGNQHRDMFALTADSAKASHLFASATMLLNGIDPRSMVKREAADEVFENRTAQILCTLQTLAAITELQQSIPPRAVYAGYSVGEIGAWGAAGVFRHTDTLKLVARRAELMSAASVAGDGLVFIRGLPYVTVRRLCETHGGDISIINPHDAFVVGGRQAFVAAVMQAATDAHAARVRRLPVEVASHTPLLSKVSAMFRNVLEGPCKTYPPPVGARLISGIDGASVSGLNSGLDKLAAQISQSVQWADNLQACVENGATAILELGPGRALSEMAAASFPNVQSRSLEDFKTMDGAKAWIAKSR
ncbi:[acyl-carrier-protein] S-malonyltransferase [Neorhizobium galegae bv. orientalis]|nr:[acyl-carrier-protein] S-malonyltransferase [Neorhizobium galegae bv. orientalis]